MIEALPHRNSGEISGLVDTGPRRAVALAAEINDAPSGISLSFDGALLNAAELRAELAKRGHAFEGDGDAEVLLRAYQHWDKEVVKRLRGPFAFAVWDAGKERLLLARDHFGQKPLYLHEAGGALAFASELRALVRAPMVKGEVDVGAVGEYLAAGYVRSPRTLVKGVTKLPPGSYAMWQFGKLRTVRYWQPPDGQESHAPEAGDPVEAFIEKLDETVHLHMSHGAPVGVLLSGGYDSAAIVALMKRHSERIATFSAGFAEDKRSELAAAARVAAHFGAEHHEVVLARRDVLADLPRLVASRDAPFSRPADVALHLLARHAARSVKVALSGDGGDEILGGYRRHTFLRTLAPKQVKPHGLFVIPIEAPQAIAGDQDENSSLRKVLYYEQTGWLPDNLLERSERMTTAAALSLRTPFVDPRIAEYVSGLPDAARVRGLSTKWILRQADARLMNGAALKLRKAGFHIPLADLMRGELRDLVAGHLGGQDCLTRAYYEGKVLDRMLDEHFASKRNHENTLWTLLNLEIWHRNHSARAPRT